jgi:ubiquinone/menaquinone biosynthesis C-methylase UbiE
MPNVYKNPEVAGAFSRFINSENGRIQRQLLYEKITSHLPDKNSKIMDAACGQGWLSGQLHKDYSQIVGFDSSEALIKEAKDSFPDINFQVADATLSLPYDGDSFDHVILNMAAHDISDLPQAFASLHKILKPGGTFIMTIANPYYAFPVGVWKRGFLGWLMRKKPSLKIRPYHNFGRGHKLFNWQGPLSSYFYPLSDYINHALEAGFSLKKFEELKIDEDSKRFDSRYQLHRFPMIILTVFEKSAK